MSVYVFVGPSLPVEEARRICPQAIILPPVRLGDVWRCAAFGGATAIGIIDGYFERVPAVWHKEILWALGNGVVVAGAASMGALRAAELAAFGMVGVGRIFEAFRSGCFAPFEEPFEDDDEVAVSHGPAETGFLSSEAMVNIRATLASAAEAGVIDPDTRDRLAALGKQLFYKERSWATLLRRAAEGGCAATVLADLRAWLPAGRTDQKRADAARLMHWLAEHPGDPPDARFHLADTTLWRREMESLPAHGGTTDDAADDLAVLDELRLRAGDWQRERTAVLALLLGPDGEDELLPVPWPVPGEEPLEPDVALRNLGTSAARQQRRLQRLQPAGRLADALLIDRLHASGVHDRLRRRAEAKRRYLLRADPETFTALMMPAETLIAWFVARSTIPLPADADALAELLDLPDAATLLDLLATEHAFVAAGRE